MECFKIENLTFRYPDSDKFAVKNLSFAVNRGEFVTLIGKSGCGKTTLLRLLKPSVSPFGDISGHIIFDDRELNSLDKRDECIKIGFVMQNPDNQIVTDKVWHELAFGLESLGMSNEEIRIKVSEMASFFGIQNWFHKDVSELSGGQKQLLNLASVMVMNPECLILDEPTSQLDPIAASEFLKTLEKINKEIGTTIILSEHRLDEALSFADRIVLMDDGEIIADGSKDAVADFLKNEKHGMFLSLPAPVKVYSALCDEMKDVPVSIRDGKTWINKYSENHEYNPENIPVDKARNKSEIAIELKNVYFRYKKDLPDVIKDLSVKIYKGEIYSVLGGNGTGKTTAMSIMGGLLNPYGGKVEIFGKDIRKNDKLYDKIGVLPQSPELLFTEKTVREDLLSVVNEVENGESLMLEAVSLCNLESLLNAHPYDLSGGEKQRAAMAKILLKNPEILLLDEPTKGMDGEFKRNFAKILRRLTEKGKTIVLVSHDVEFCSEYADCCAMFFDGGIVTEGSPRRFFSGKHFYTTGANRMTRDILPGACLAEDIIKAFGGQMPDIPEKEINIPDVKRERKDNSKKKLKIKNIITGSLFAVLFFALEITLGNYFVGWKNYAIQTISLILLAISLMNFFPQKEIVVSKTGREQNKITKSSFAVIFASIMLLPITLWLGTNVFDDRKYYFTGLLIIAEALIPFLVLFEKRKPKARELVIISVMVALAVAGRSAFFMTASFKPMLALVAITGVSFGAETGFLVGALAAFVSNFFFGQGPWTPWQMVAFALIGGFFGMVYSFGVVKRTRFSLSILGAFSAMVIYGGIMNPASVFTITKEVSKEALLASFSLGLPHDIMHAASSFIFLWFISEAMIKKLERIKKKYGLIKR